VGAAGEWRRTAAQLVLIQAVVGFGAGLLIPFVDVLYKVRFGLPDPLLGALFAASSVVTALGTLVVPVVAQRLGKVRAAVISQALSIPFLLLMGFSAQLAWSAVGFLVRTALMNMVAPALSALFMELVPERRRALTSGLVVLGWNVAWAVSAFLSGRLQVAVGFATIFLITASFYALVPALTYGFFRHAREAREEERAA
jgi:MFS family permease